MLCLAVLLVLAVGSTDSKSSSDRPSSSIAEGNRIITDADKGTTLQKERHIEANKGKTFDFEGEVQDVTDEKTLKVELDSGEFAEVSFNHLVDKLEKGAQIKFRATIEAFGTGFFSKHILTGAEMKK